MWILVRRIYCCWVGPIRTAVASGIFDTLSVQTGFPGADDLAYLLISAEQRMFDFGFKLGRKLLSGGGYTALQKLVGRKKSYFNQDHFFTILAKYEKTASFTGKNIVEFGQGNEIATAVLMILRGANHVYLVDKINTYTSHGSNNSTLYIARLLETFGSSVGSSSLAPAEIESKITFIDSFFSDEAIGQIPPRSIDCIVSHTVLEHVENIQDIFRTSSRLLKQGGLFCAIVDLSDHTYHFMYRYQFLLKYIKNCRFKHMEYSNETWRKLDDNARLHMNRTLLPRYLEGLKRFGFAVDDLEITREGPEYRFAPHQDILGTNQPSEDEINRVSGFTLSATLESPGQ